MGVSGFGRLGFRCLGFHVTFHPCSPCAVHPLLETRDLGPQGFGDMGISRFKGLGFRSLEVWGFGFRV